MQPGHPRDPPVVVVGLGLHIALHLRVGQDQEPLFGDRREAGLRHLLRGQDPVNAGHMVFVPRDHVGVDRLRAQQRNLDAVRRMGKSNPLGQSDGGVFRHAIGRGADLVQQPCRRSRV